MENYWKLENPKDGLRMASINLANGHYYLTTQWTWQPSPNCDGYGFSSLVSAKRYFSAHYQSIKYGCSRPIWKGEYLS